MAETQLPAQLLETMKKELEDKFSDRFQHIEGSIASLSCVITRRTKEMTEAIRSLSNQISYNSSSDTSSGIANQQNHRTGCPPNQAGVTRRAKSESLAPTAQIAHTLHSDSVHHKRLGSFNEWLVELNQLEETDGILEYHAKFEHISTNLTLPEEYLVSVYLAGLRNDTQMNVRMFQPQSLQQCLMIGRLYESAHPIKRSTDALHNEETKESLIQPSNFVSTEEMSAIRANEEENNGKDEDMKSNTAVVASLKADKRKGTKSPVKPQDEQNDQSEIEGHMDGNRASLNSSFVSAKGQQTDTAFGITLSPLLHRSVHMERQVSFIMNSEELPFFFLLGVSIEDFIEVELVQKLNSPVVAETSVKSCNSQPYTNNDGLVIAATSNADNDDLIKAVAVSRRVLCVHKPLRVHSKKKTTKRKSWRFKYKSFLTGHISVLLKTVLSYWDMVMPRVKQRKVDCRELKAMLISSQSFEVEASDDLLDRRTRTTTVRKDRELMRVKYHTNWQFSPLTLCFLQHHIAVIHYEFMGSIDWVSFSVEQLCHDGPMENQIPFERCRILQQFAMSQFMLKPRVCKTGENCNLLNNQRFLKFRRFKFKAKAQPRELVHDTLCLKESGYINVDILKDAQLEHTLSPVIILVVNLRHGGLFQHLATVLKWNFLTHQVFMQFFSWGTISSVVFELLSRYVSRVWDPGGLVDCSLLLKAPRNYFHESLQQSFLINLVVKVFQEGKICYRKIRVRDVDRWTVQIKDGKS